MAVLEVALVLALVLVWGDAEETVKEHVSLVVTEVAKVLAQQLVTTLAVAVATVSNLII